MTNIHSEKILILDFGSQYTQLIARSVREVGTYCEIWSYNCTDEDVRRFAPNGIILSGGPETVLQGGSPRAPQTVFELGVPVLGICYGMQTMTEQLGGQVESSTRREFGHAQLELVGDTSLFDGLPNSLDVWMSHGDKVVALPDGFKNIGRSGNSPFAAIANEDKSFYGLQFHPEVTHTVNGRDIIAQFVQRICNTNQLWTPGNIADETIAHMREIVGEEHVILGLSGGVDSSVTAALLHRAIGEQLHCVFVDNGLLRLNEGDQLMEVFSGAGVHIIRVNAQQRFYDALKGVSDPEQKRKIIGNLFIQVFEEEASKIDNATWLAQGTIYPDVIESAGSVHGHAHVIKSHHNVGGLPEHMNLKLLEPLRELFKDEVRKLGEELGLSHDMVYRHPFPGPGLGVRILGEVKEEYAALLRRADAIFIEELRKAGWYDQVAQALAVFLPVRSVGVMGDGRRYDYVIALRAVQTIDFMTAKWAALPYELLGTVSNRIINEIDGISRVTYDISGKPPATIEWE